jgi:hypothetical protein
LKYKEKKPKDPDVARAVLWWDAKYKVGKERIILNPFGETCPDGVFENISGHCQCRFVAA